MNFSLSVDVSPPRPQHGTGTGRRNLDLEAVKMDVGLLIASLKECSRSRSLAKGKELHALANRSGDISDRYVTNSLVNMYLMCGYVVDARAVFDSMVVHDVVAWTALLQGYVKNGESEMALEMFDCMEQEGCPPNARTYVSALSACVTLSGKDNGNNDNGMWTEKAKLIHSRAIVNDCCETFLENMLIDVYSKFERMSKAQAVFYSMVEPDIVSWNTLLQGCVENLENELALELFDSMREQDQVRDLLDCRTYLAVLTACGNLVEKDEGKATKWLEKGKSIHSRVTETKRSDIFVETALVVMYSKCRCMEEARTVFNKMSRHDVVSWNALLQGYVDNGQSRLALELFDNMEQARGGCSPDARTYLTALTACTALAAQEDGKETGKWLAKGTQIHSRAAASQSCNSFVETELVNMYSTCGEMSAARSVFDKMVNRSLVSWNCMAQGYVDNKQYKTALEIVDLMKSSGVTPDSGTYVAALMACGNLTDTQVGMILHGEIRDRGLQKNLQVVNCLVDFYAKCGKMEVAEEVFDSIPVKDIVSWNTLVSGYSVQGDSKRVIELFERMREQGVTPDGITFTCLLIACSHAGLTRKGVEYFDMMRSEYGLCPSIRHYAGLVDLYGRANFLDEAVKVVREMPFKANDVIWCTLLSACQKWNNVTVGEMAYEALLELDEKDPVSYVMMANIYKVAGMWSKREKVLARKELDCHSHK